MTDTPPKRGPGRPRKGPGVINWLRLESRINKAYDALAVKSAEALAANESLELVHLVTALREISNAVGEEIGRGFPLEKAGI